MPSSTSLGCRQGRPRPSARRGSLGIRGSKTSHCSPVRSTFTPAKRYFLGLMLMLSLSVWRSKRVMLHIQLMGKATEEQEGGVALETVKNFVGGNPVAVEVEDELDIPDPATEELLGRVPLSGKEDVDRAVRAAAEAFEEWREEPVTRRARRMFKLQVLLEDNMEDLAELCTRENGKHVEESKGEILCGIEVVELAASM